jgi:hypothetical protein
VREGTAVAIYASMRSMPFLVTVVLASAVPLAAGKGDAAGPRQAAEQPRVQIEMRNVRLHVMTGVALDVRRLRGEMQSRAEGRPPVFDDQASYVLHVSTAQISMDMTSLSNLMNRQIFAYRGAPISGVTVRAIDGGRIEQRGTLHKGVSVPFSMKASVSTTPDGRLRLHVESVKALGIPAKGLLDLFGLKLENLLDLKQRRGIEVDGHDVLMAPGDVLPPPRIVGRLVRAEVRDGALLQVFAPADGRQPAALKPPMPRANYMYFSGGNIRFGKLTMSDADLQLIDADPRDPFDFFPARYNDQLVAGYSKNTPRQGLKTFMPDFNDLHGNRQQAAGSRQ